MSSGAYGAVSTYLDSATPSWFDRAASEVAPIMERAAGGRSGEGRVSPLRCAMSQWSPVAPGMQTQEQESLVQPLLDVLRLPPDWDGYGSPPPYEKAAETAWRLLTEGTNPMGQPASVCPISGGGIQLEWHRSGKDLEIAIDPDGTATFMVASDGVVREGHLPLNVVDSVPTLMSWILR